MGEIRENWGEGLEGWFLENKCLNFMKFRIIIELLKGILFNLYENSL